MNTQFDITEISNLIMKSFERKMLKEISMYDSINKIIEQQYRLANMTNSIYTPEFIRMQQIYSDVMAQVQPFTTFALQNMSNAATALEQSINSAWENINIDYLASVVRQISLPTETIQNMQIDLFTGYGEVVKRLISLSENEIELIVDGTDFTAEEVLEDINKLKETDLVSENSVLNHDNILLKEKWDNFLKQHPALANVIYIIGFFVTLISGIFTVNEFGELVVLTTQEAIVRIEGKQDILFVESDSATVYCEPSVHADIIGEVYYSDKVKRIDENNMWDKIIYYDTTREIHIGWIASKELISYKEWKFNLDK